MKRGFWDSLTLATSGELGDYIALMLNILADFEDIAVDLIKVASTHDTETSQAVPSSGVPVNVLDPRQRGA